MVSGMVARWRGIKTWPEATATVFTSEVISEGGYKQAPPSVEIVFSYRDEGGTIQSGSFVADSLTSLYNLKVGDEFPIQFDPQHPAKFYVAGLSSWFTNMRLVLSIGLLAVVVLAALI